MERITERHRDGRREKRLLCDKRSKINQFCLVVASLLNPLFTWKETILIFYPTQAVIYCFSAEVVIVREKRHTAEHSKKNSHDGYSIYVRLSITSLLSSRTGWTLRVIKVTRWVPSGVQFSLLRPDVTVFKTQEPSVCASKKKADLSTQCVAVPPP